jgi:hypothetical protein
MKSNFYQIVLKGILSKGANKNFSAAKFYGYFEASQESSGNFPGLGLQVNITSPCQEDITLAVTLFPPQKRNPFLNSTRKILCSIGSFQYQKGLAKKSRNFLHFLQCIAMSG